MFSEREKRIADAIALKKPDRIPVWGGVPGRFTTETLGIGRSAEMMDISASLEASFRAAEFFQPDFVELMPPLGPVLTALDYKHLAWAGRGRPANSGWQFMEDECMKPEEYPEFIYDPSDFIVRKYWPRAFRKLSFFGRLAPLRQAQGYFSTLNAFAPFGTPEGLEALEAMREAGAAALRTVQALGAHAKRLRDAGFPLSWSASAQPPLDLVGDFLRGRKGVMLDMHRRPKDLIAATEKMLPMAIECGIGSARMSGSKRVFIAIHGGVEGFMSPQQYERFYWPTLRELMLGLIAEDLTPFVLVEGGSTSRLKTMSDIPPGKVCYWFDHVDMTEAKRVLRDKACIAGNVPLDLLSVGSPNDVRAYCKKLIDIAGEDGGYILGPSGQNEDAKVENVKAMIDFTKEYGVY